MELAATPTGKITAVRANVTASMGAYLQLVTPGIPLLGAWLYAGPYAIPNYGFTCTGVFTNTTPTDAYRGAGRPEATYVARAGDGRCSRRSSGIDPVELRRRNFITEFPHTIASGLDDRHRRLPGVARQLLEHARATTSSRPSRRRAATAAT